jgi:type I restriction enzyme M protein
MSLNNIQKIESALWDAADNLRANSNLTSSDYCMPVLGVIFLRHATNRHDAAVKAIEVEQTAGLMPRRPLLAADFLKRRALMLPAVARFDYLLQLPKGENLGAALIRAMDAIEAEFEPLRGQLPKDYDRFDNDLIESLLRTFDSEPLRQASGDVFGRIYEYFLMKFAMQGAQDNGEFFTPPSLVQVLVNVIEPDHGTVLDPACGSGGMFVQTSHFLEEHGQDTASRVTFFGQEKTATTIRLAKMNLAVHGLEGDIREANTFYQDEHSLVGRCDFVMANPPFNVDLVDAGKVKGDVRLPFGLPGVSKGAGPKVAKGEEAAKAGASAGKVGNGNYLWISYFYSYLKPSGRAGFVMSSQASSAGHGEAEVRRKLVETGAVDVMVAIRSNFFYTRTVPCELWHLDRGKPKERLDQVLMLDARQIYRKVTRKIYDFTPEQLKNLTSIVWLYRGERQRFLGLVRDYLGEICSEAVGLRGAVVPFLEGLAELERLSAAGSGPAVREATAALRSGVRELAGASEGICKELEAFAAEWLPEVPLENERQHQMRQGCEPLVGRCKDLGKRIDAQFKLAGTLVQALQELPGDKRGLGRRLKELDEARRVAVEQSGRVGYCWRQVVWLHERFPQAEMAAVPGLCRVVGRGEIAEADWSLTPGRYVGVAPAEVDEDFDFAVAMREIHGELEELNREAVELAATVADSIMAVL